MAPCRLQPEGDRAPSALRASRRPPARSQPQDQHASKPTNRYKGDRVGGGGRRARRSKSPRPARSRQRRARRRNGGASPPPPPCFAWSPSPATSRRRGSGAPHRPGGRSPGLVSDRRCQRADMETRGTPQRQISVHEWRRQDAPRGRIFPHSREGASGLGCATVRLFDAAHWLARRRSVDGLDGRGALHPRARLRRPSRAAGRPGAASEVLGGSDWESFTERPKCQENNPITPQILSRP